MRAIFALVVVLGLIGLAAYAARRAPQLRLGSLNPATRRLAVTERIMLDPRRQVMILRDGTREHVILLGLAGEQILESRAAGPQAEATPLRLIEPGAQS